MEPSKQWIEAGSGSVGKVRFLSSLSIIKQLLHNNHTIPFLDDGYINPQYNELVQSLLFVFL